MRKIWTLPEHRAITTAWQLCQTDHFAPSFETIARIIEDYDAALESERNGRDLTPKLAPCCRRHPSACSCESLGLVR